MRFLAVMTVRNEGAFLLEWLAHHKAVGFTDFLVYSNDCDDGTDKMLDRLQDLGHLTHIRNDGPHEGGVQWTALRLADKHKLTKQADWILPIDIDEFVNIHTGDHTLPALIAALPDATAITLTWRFFGNNEIVRFRDEPVTQQFRMAAPKIMFWPWRAAIFKTLFRNDGAYKKMGVHRPKSPVDGKVEKTRWFDGHGRELDTSYQRQRLFSPFGRDNYGLVQLNHYALGAMESYLVKCDRGRANRDDGQLGMSYWVDRNWSVEQDDTIDALRPVSEKFRAELMSDPELSELHSKAVVWRKKRFESLMRQDEFRALFGRLLLTPPSRPVSAKVANFLFQFAQRPDQDRD